MEAFYTNTYNLVTLYSPYRLYLCFCGTEKTKNYVYPGAFFNTMESLS